MKFPTISHSRLDNGLELRVVTRKTYPIIELRLVLFSGIASDGAEPGVAAVAGELLKAGGAGKWNAADLAERAESLGASLDVVTDRDSTRITMAVTTADLDAALDLIGAVAQQPRFAPVEFDKLKQRELERVRNAAKASAGWAASMVLYRELFDLPTAVHPYAHYDAKPSELNKLTLASCRRWYQSNVTPGNATLVVAGDVDAATAEAAAKRVFAGWKGTKPSGQTYNNPVPPEGRTVWLVDRPHSAQSQIYVAGLGPERGTPAWPALCRQQSDLGRWCCRTFVPRRAREALTRLRHQLELGRARAQPGADRPFGGHANGEDRSCHASSARKSWTRSRARRRAMPKWAWPRATSRTASCSVPKRSARSLI